MGAVRDLIFREARFEISLMLFVLAIFAMVEAITHALFYRVAPFTELHDAIGGWVIWTGFLGLLLLFGGGYYTWDSLRKRKDFKRLIDTTSKQKFLRNREEIERLAFALPRAFEIKMNRKMKELDLP